MRSAAWFVPEATLVILLLAGCTSLTGETLRQNIDDATITAMVKSRLAAEKVSTLTRIGVDTVQGTVFLMGIVESAAMKERAGEIAREVQGVRGMVNNLRVQSG